MIKNYPCFLLVVVLPLWVLAVTPAAATTILILGDSLSDAYNMPRESGWAHELSRRLGPDYEVINASISGETSAGGAQRIESLLDDTQPQVLLLILGGNDGLRALNPRQLESNLESIILKGKSAGTEVVLMQIRMPPNLGPVYVERFEAVYPRLSERHGVLLVPFFLDELFDQPGMLMSDGIHPTVRAQSGMLDRLWPHLKSIEALSGHDWVNQE